jgi:2-polyprenyl-3-methyl-5-hydroxy-6-metoxy-1,4-benzoquinol methylase
VFHQPADVAAALEKGESMRVTIDPEGHEIDAIHELVDFSGQNVLEVGCGDGRMTWRYAERTASVLAIDPDQECISKAIGDTPHELRSKVVFRADDINGAAIPEDAFGVVVLSYSL